MTLPQGWVIEEESSNELPLGWTVEEEQPIDVISDELRAAGVEPDIEEETERLAERGIAEATRGLFSGATFGLSENVPGLKTGENIAATTGKTVGSFAPISKLFNWFGGAATKIASKSPVLQKQLSSLGNIIGAGLTGATVKGLETATKGEVPNASDLLEHGAEWATIDAVLQTLGAGGRFTSSLLRKAKDTAKPPYKVLNETLQKAKAAGEGVSTAEQTAAKALEILEQETPIAERVLTPPEVPVNPVEQALEPVRVQQAEVITPKDLKSKKISEAPFQKLDKETIKLAEPYQPSKINFEEEVKSLEDSDIASRIDSVAPRAASEQELGTSIQENIEAQLKADKDAYRPFYEEAEEAAENILHVPENTAKVASNRLKEITKVKTSPQGYPAVVNNLESVLNDVGIKVTKLKNGSLEFGVYETNQPVKKTIELGRRLNEIIDYEAIEPSVKDVLKKVVRAVKQDIREGLKANPDALAAFELAEKEHARVAEKFGKDAVRKVRESSAGERIAKMLDSPTTFEEVSKVVSPEERAKIERSILDRLNEQSYEKSKKQLKEFERHLSENNKKIAREIVENKNPYNPQVRRKAVQQGVLDEMSESFTTGDRPSKTLNLWKTKKGQELVKDTFKNSPNWKQVKEYLEKQSFNDIVSSVMKNNGSIDFKKFKDFMKDPGVIHNVRMLGGEEAVQFFRKMDESVRTLDKNVKLLENLPKKSDVKRGKELLNKIKERESVKPVKVAKEALAEKGRLEKETSTLRGSRILKRMAEKDFPLLTKAYKFKDLFAETMGITPKAAMGVFSLMKLGIPNTVISLVGFKIFSKLATSPRLRRAFREAAKNHTDPVSFLVAFEEFSDLLNKEE